MINDTPSVPVLVLAVPLPLLTLGIVEDIEYVEFVVGVLIVGLIVRVEGELVTLGRNGVAVLHIHKPIYERELASLSVFFNV